jgi:hypothetical protein
MRKWRVRSGQLKRNHRSFSRSRLRRQSNGCGCTSQFYRCGSANPFEPGTLSRRWPCTREPLYHLALSADDNYKEHQRRFRLFRVQCSAITDHSEPMTPVEIADATGQRRTNVRQIGAVVQNRGPILDQSGLPRSHRSHRSQGGGRVMSVTAVIAVMGGQRRCHLGRTIEDGRGP